MIMVAGLDQLSVLRTMLPRQQFCAQLNLGPIQPRVTCHCLAPAQWNRLVLLHDDNAGSSIPVRSGPAGCRQASTRTSLRIALWK
jgi:hypothetical protein